MAKILIPTPLRQFTAKQDSVTVPGATVGEVLAALTTEYPDLRKQIFNDEGKLRSFVNVYLNDEDIRYLIRTLPRGGWRHAVPGASIAGEPRHDRPCCPARQSRYRRKKPRYSRVTGLFPKSASKGRRS